MMNFVVPDLAFADQMALVITACAKKHYKQWVLINASTPNCNASTFSYYQFSYRIQKWDARIKYAVTLVPAHVRTLDLKHQSSPKVRIQVWSLNWPFHSFQIMIDPEDNPQQAELGDFEHYHPSE
ncbi:hypothetical protein TNCV_2868931 [Trichonephila clavipes]|nr:hypothetical protein TNCV_2868931 [Trichonephila clavipes]